MNNAKCLDCLLTEHLHIKDKITNGDVIKALFPNSEPLFVLGNVPKEDIIKIDNEVFMVERSWWNAPYKEGANK